MKTIAVIGDVMLDVFSNGSAHRLSPEAPVPILANPVTTSILGGAANTAANTPIWFLRTNDFTNEPRPFPSPRDRLPIRQPPPRGEVA